MNLRQWKLFSDGALSFFLFGLFAAACGPTHPEQIEVPTEVTTTEESELSVADCMRLAEWAKRFTIFFGTPVLRAQRTYELAALKCQLLSPPSNCETERQCRTVAKAHLELELTRGKPLASLSASIDLELKACRRVCVGKSTDLEKCAEQVPLREDVPPAEREILYQADLARYCSAPGISRCRARLIGLANVDYSASAAQLISGKVVPAEYLALSRDRTRKLRAAEEDPKRAVKLCTGNDSDGDWIVDSIDQCPNTPDLTATDDNGCPVAKLPDAPSKEDVGEVLSKMHLVINPRCRGAKAPLRVPAGAFYWPSDASRGTYILSGQVLNQPAGCPVWYEFDIQDISGPTAGDRYSVVFMETEASNDLVGLGRPVPTGFVQFNPRPGDPGTRARLGSTGGHAGIRYRVRVMNGNGARSPWSDFKVPNRADCTALGFTCGGRQ